MRSSNWIIALILGLCAIERSAADDAEDRVVAAVEKLGGRVVRDEANPDKPVVEVTLEKLAVADPLLKDIAQLKSLVKLNLNQTKVTDAGLKEIGELKQLAYLFLGDTGITDAGLKELKALKNLTRLDLYGTQLTNEGLKELANSVGDRHRIHAQKLHIRKNPRVFSI